MLSIAELAAPLALALPVLGLASAPFPLSGLALSEPALVGEGVPGASLPVVAASAAAAEASEIEGQTFPVSQGAAPTSLDAVNQDLRVGQIRIEQRVIVRIAPQRSASRQSLLAQLPQRAVNTRYEERKADKCLAVERIAGVQTGSGSRLLLFLQDSKIMSLNLEKACRARDFYSGFYVERASDGKLCVDRDKLQSRNGVRCEIESMKHLVALKD